SASRVELALESGLTCVERISDVTRDVDCVVTMVRDTSDLREVLRADGGVFDSLEQSTLLLDLSSVSPSATEEFAAEAERLGHRYVDAPVSGGEQGAKAGTLSIM